MFTFIGGLGISEMAFMSIIFIFLLMFVAQIFAIIHIVRSNLESNIKLIWAIVTVFVPFGWLVYFIAGQKKDE